MFGSHLSIAGSMTSALREAEGLGLDTVQVFTKNQQQWKAPPLDPAAVRDWSAEVKRLGWHEGCLWQGRPSGRIVAHASYLINLASPSDELWEKSIGLMRIELERCEALGIPFLVHHPGSSTGSGAEAGMRRIAQAYARLFAETAGFRTVSCLENTVGGGETLGRELGQLAELRRRIVEATGQPDRVGYCIDTCHAHAGGYDLSMRQGGEQFLQEFDRVCGLGWLGAAHLNDSKAAMGSRRDLHEHIGHGTIGGPPRRAGGLASSGFAAFVNHPALARVPKILETPKGNNARGTPHDRLNLRRLGQLLASGEPIKSVPPPGPGVGGVGRARRPAGGSTRGATAGRRRSPSTAGREAP